MTPFESINNLEDYAIQAGSHLPISITCYNTDGSALNLTGFTLGLTISLYGDNTTLQNISGTIHAGTTNVVDYVITSSMTESMDDCVLIYRPVIISGATKYKFQGKIYVSATSVYTPPV